MKEGGAVLQGATILKTTARKGSTEVRLHIYPVRSQIIAVEGGYLPGSDHGVRRLYRLGAEKTHLFLTALEDGSLTLRPQGEITATAIGLGRACRREFLSVRLLVAK